MLIKVRAWHKEEKRMWYDVLQEMGEVDNYDDDISMWSVGHMMEKGDNSLFEFMLFTGLKDVNGKLIYEGDILHNIKSEYDSKMYGVVEYGEDSACFDVIWYKGQYGEEWEQFLFEPVQLDEVVVVGNVYENPEMMEMK